MRISFLGNFIQPHSSENDYAWTLRSMGHEVECLQEEFTSPEQIILSAKNANIFFWVHTHSWDKTKMYPVIKAIKEAGIPTFGYHLDLFLGTSRQYDVSSHPFFSMDYIFTVDGNLDGIVPNHYWIKPGICRRNLGSFTHYPEPDNQTVAFVGNYNYHNQWPYRQSLVDMLKEVYGDDFVHIGAPNQELRGLELTRFYQETAVIIGDSFCPGFTHPQYWSDRATETMGRGGFLIHPYIKGMDETFRHREHLVYYPFQDFEQLSHEIDFYRRRPEERNRIRNIGSQAVAQHHTYHDRFEQMFSIMSLRFPWLAR